MTIVRKMVILLMVFSLSQPLLMRACAMKKASGVYPAQEIPIKIAMQLYIFVMNCFPKGEMKSN